MGKILLINNDFDVLSLLEKWLNKKHHKVKYTSNGEEAPQLIKEFSPDVMLIDVLHSDVAEELKTNEDTKEIPIILMTGYTITNKTPTPKNADDVIEKPFNLSLLEQKIDRFLLKSV